MKLEEIKNISENYLLISGHFDVKLHQNGYYFIDNKKDYFIISGNADESEILDVLSDTEFNFDTEGEWYCEFLFKIVNDRDEYQHWRYFNLVENKIEFIQTFTQRDRQEKLDDLLLRDFNDIFGIHSK